MKLSWRKRYTFKHRHRQDVTSHNSFFNNFHFLDKSSLIFTQPSPLSHPPPPTSHPPSRLPSISLPNTTSMATSIITSISSSPFSSITCLAAENLCLAKNRKNCVISCKNHVKLRKNHVKSCKNRVNRVKVPGKKSAWQQCWHADTYSAPLINHFHQHFNNHQHLHLRSTVSQRVGKKHTWPSRHLTENNKTNV